MFDVLTVIFRDDLPMFRVQAQSIDLYCQDIGIKNIFVIVNDDTLANEIDVNWYGSLSDRVRVIPRTQLGRYYHKEGWISQQYLKLKGSTLSNNEWVIVLDAKGIFVKKIYLKKFFDMFGRIKVGYGKLNPFWKEAGKTVSKLFKIDTVLETGPPPFLFKVNLIKDLVKEMDTQVCGQFDEWFQTTPITEILLYDGYVQSRYKFFWQYANRFKYLERCCIGRNVIDTADNLFDTKLFQKQHHMVMIHRNVWKVLSIERKEKYKAFLISKGLTSASELKC